MVGKIKWDNEYKRSCELCGTAKLQGIIIILEIDKMGSETQILVAK